MTFIDIPPQSEILYNARWNAAMDRCFLGTLLEQQRLRNWKFGDANVHAVLMAMGTVNIEFGLSITLDEAHERLAELETRYLTFKKIVEETDGAWDQYVNVVSASRNFWRTVFQRSSLARAYFHQGEPEFSALVTLFAPPATNMHLTNPSDVIIVSEGGCQPVLAAPRQANTLIVISSDDSAEVQSPIVVEERSARKRLFDDITPKTVQDPMDAHSTNLVDPFGVSYGPPMSQRFPSRNAFPPKPKIEAGPSAAPGSSSCASSSPGNPWVAFHK